MDNFRFEALALLKNIKNVKRGIETRSRIICILKLKDASLIEISKTVKKGSTTISYHLKNMEKEGIVIKVNKRWKLTGKGQQDLLSFIQHS